MAPKSAHVIDLGAETVATADGYVSRLKQVGKGKLEFALFGRKVFFARLREASLNKAIYTQYTQFEVVDIDFLNETEFKWMNKWMENYKNNLIKKTNNQTNNQTNKQTKKQKSKRTTKQPNNQTNN